MSPCLGERARVSRMTGDQTGAAQVRQTQPVYFPSTRLIGGALGESVTLRGAASLRSLTFVSPIKANLELNLF